MKVCAEHRVTGLASSAINRGSIFHSGVGGYMWQGVWDSYFEGAPREAESKLPQ